MREVTICPACGFSFHLEVKTKKRQIKCPMCGYKFSDPTFIPQSKKEFDNKCI
ncbi:MAG: hypothetical protein ACFE92_06295 [Promethearchaeota archaeon]